MRVTIDNNYGADADGNRGIKVYEYELEESDRDDIVAQLTEAFDEGAIDEADSTCCINFICPYTEETICLEVNIADYITITKGV